MIFKIEFVFTLKMYVNHYTKDRIKYHVHGCTHIIFYYNLNKFTIKKLMNKMETIWKICIQIFSYYKPEPKIVKTIQIIFNVKITYPIYLK